MFCQNSDRKDAPSIYVSYSSVLESALKQCFSAMHYVLFILPTSFSPLPTRNVLPTFQKSNMIYHFSCHCDSRYVGCTSQRLQSTIEPHVSKPICSPSSSHKRLFSVSRFKSSIQTNTQYFASDSATGLQFLPNLALLNIIMTVDFLFLPKAVLLSICLLLKPISSKLLTSPFADKKNS